jgi:hypothetical protein
MSTALAPRIGNCPEYQRLLGCCERTLTAWQQYRTRAERDALLGARLRAHVSRLKEEYARANALLESHERFCQTCQYISKVGGLDFESLSNALHRHGPFS